VLVVGAGIEVAIGQRVTKGHGVIEGQDTDGNERAAAKEKQMRARRTLRSRRPALRPQQVEEEGRQNAGEQHVGLAHDCAQPAAKPAASSSHAWCGLSCSLAAYHSSNAPAMSGHTPPEKVSMLL